MTAARALKQPRIRLDDFDGMLLHKPNDEKWELVEGRILKSMVGARWGHHSIISNIDFAVSSHLRAKGLPSRTFRESFYLRDDDIELSMLPDLMIRCGKLAPDATSLNDPKIIVEVVSPSSEEHDRLTKRLAYQRLASLEQYVLVTRDRMLVDVYRRTPAGWAGDVQLETPDALLALPGIDFTMPLAEIYRDALGEGG